MAISTVSLSNTTQAAADTYSYTEQQLIDSGLLDQVNNWVTLDVMANDAGGKAKTLWSVDDGQGALTDLLASNVNTGWEHTFNADGSDTGILIRIYDSKVQLDLTGALDGGSVADMTDGETVGGSFLYAIRMGNGTLSYAKITFAVSGEGLAGPKPIYGTENGEVLSGVYADNNTMYGLGGNDYMYGGVGNDSMYGGDGNDLLNGSDGDDLLDGGAGDDLIFGGSGNDQMSGGSGNDLMVGYGGQDSFNGGEGSDVILLGGIDNGVGYLSGNAVIVFDTPLAAEGIDTLGGFNAGGAVGDAAGRGADVDLITLSAAVFADLSNDPNGLWLAADHFTTVDALDTSTTARIVYDPASGALYYDANGGAIGDAQQIAQFAASTLQGTLDASDFLVVYPSL